MAARGHAVPDYRSSPTGTPSRAESLLEGGLPKAKALATLANLCSLPPLSMPSSEFAASGITCHSPHGSGCDMIRFVGMNARHSPFVTGDDRRAGHWLRDKHADQDHSEMRRPGSGNARGDMVRRYSQGPGRRGEREEQLELRSKMVDHVRGSLATFGRPWTELPPGLADWDILRPAPSPETKEELLTD